MVSMGVRMSMGRKTGAEVGLTWEAVGEEHFGRICD